MGLLMFPVEEDTYKGSCGILTAVNQGAGTNGWKILKL
jgi:hypothetical protein